MQFFSLALGIPLHYISKHCYWLRKHTQVILSLSCPRYQQPRRFLKNRFCLFSRSPGKVFRKQMVNNLVTLSF